MTAMRPSILSAMPFAIRKADIVFPAPGGPNSANLSQSRVLSAFLKAI
jgi:hypothetical protein